MVSTKRTSTTRSQRGKKPAAAASKRQANSETRGKPLKAAIIAGGAVAAGVFLWSRRTSVTDRISEIGEQLGELRETFGSHEQQDQGPDARAAQTPKPRKRGRRSQAEIAQEALRLKEEGAARRAEFPVSEVVPPARSSWIRVVN